MNKTGIAWSDYTWNPVSGCDKVSPGCTYCYAETLAEQKRGTPAFPHGFELRIKPWKMREIGAVKKPSLIFVNSMSDFAHEGISDAYRDDMIAEMVRYPQHRFQILTKRIYEMARYFDTREVPDNVWLGVSIESQEYVWRLDALREIVCITRFVSCEPLLSPLVMDLAGIHLVITGGESGGHLIDPKLAEKRSLALKTRDGWIPRPSKIEWVRSIKEQADAMGVAFFHKQWGGPQPQSAGRLLDGKTWDAMPSNMPSEQTLRLL